MSWITTSLLLIPLGVMTYLVLIPITAAILPYHVGRPVIRHYQKIAMGLIKSGIMLQRSHGSITLKKAKYDAKVNAMYIRIGGEKEYFEDPNNYLSTLFGYTFGLAYEHEDGAIIADARIAYLAREYQRLKTSGEWIKQGARKALFSIPTERRLVNLADIKYVTQMSASPRAVTREQTHAEKSQAGFNSPNIVDTMTWIITLGAAMGLMWLAREVSVRSSGSGGGDVLPILIDTWSVIPV